MADEYIGVAAIAKRCGVSRQTVQHWVLKHGPSGDNTFPEPKVQITNVTDEDMTPDTDRRMVYGWTYMQLEEIYARFAHQDEDVAA